jgi:hypothetical protein
MTLCIISCVDRTKYRLRHGWRHEHGSGDLQLLGGICRRDFLHQLCFSSGAGRVPGFARYRQALPDRIDGRLGHHLDAPRSIGFSRM